MGFGEYDGTLDNAEKRIGESAGLRCLLPGALIGDWLEFLREVVRKRLEHARNDLLHPGICIGKLHREGTQQASSAPKLWRAFLQMLKKGKSLFNRVRNSGREGHLPASARFAEETNPKPPDPNPLSNQKNNRSCLWSARPSHKSHPRSWPIVKSNCTKIMLGLHFFRRGPRGRIQ